MTKNKKAANAVQSILVEQFHVEKFDFNKPLEVLHEDFKLLDKLVYLEQLLEKKFQKKIPILENISASVHTPMDIVQLIVNK